MSRAIHFRRYLNGRPHGRALLSYLKQPITEEINNIKTSQFSNNGAGRTWGKVLNQLGYTVDVINWDDAKFRAKYKYDIIIVHGGKNYKNLLSSLKRDGKIVYYSTGSYWNYHNEQEGLRFKQFADRTGHTLLQDRHIGDNEEEINRKANAIISLGNKDTAATYKEFSNVYSLEGAGYLGAAPILRNYNDTRKHFLFLSGPGNIHKVLDLAIEAFREMPDLHLHIVTVLNPDFEEYYKKDLHQTANIHTYGYVPQRSALFYAVARQCSYSILLSCSEGSPGSVIESMQQGLIPIVTKSSHIDLPPAGILVNDITVSGVKKIIQGSSKSSAEKVEANTAQVKEYAKKNLSVPGFEKKLKSILAQISDKT